MMRSLFSGVSGLRNHQTRMDVIGNNIANVNTIGFKGSRANFQDVLNQTLQGASSGTGNRGGTNPVQVGLGMGMSSIDTMFTDGSTQPTGKQTDLAIQGQGFFILSDGNSQVYTRAGNFDFDKQGNYLVPGSGYKVMGWQANNQGDLNTSGPVTSIQIPVGATMPARPTEKIIYEKNLSADDPIGTTVLGSIKAFDSLGNPHMVTQIFVKESNNTWLTSARTTDGTITAGQMSRITFTSAGVLDSITAVTATTPPTALNIPSFRLNYTPGSVDKTSYTVFDSNGTPHVYQMITTKTEPNKWNYQIVNPANPTGTPLSSGPITWDAGAIPPAYSGLPASFSYNDGINTNTVALTISAQLPPALPPAAAATIAISNPTYTAGGAPGILKINPTGGALPMDINLDMGKLTQYGGASTLWPTGQDGYAAGTLDSILIDPSGVVVGRFTNGESQNLAQVALATFNNPGGLSKYGNSLFVKSNNSGEAQVGTSDSGGRGGLTPGALEMANVDLAQEFSNMIITQRGFQANSKVITTTDQMLEELANLKR